ncbi:MAG: metallophosphoesterase [Clostridia bacterium]|nr:metallophosphoesterase [Clostridia bacterium]
MTPQINRITWTDPGGRLRRPVKIAFVSDLHDCDHTSWLRHAEGVDLIAVAGDLTNRHVHELPKHAEAFLRDAARIAPVFCSIGNHERRMPKAVEWRDIMDRSGVTVLDNAAIRYREDLSIGGFSSQESVTDLTAVDLLEREPGFRLLLCHHPEYFEPWILGRGVDLTLSGHAHGGQIRLFNRGLYSPGQGLFPKWTSGFYFHRRLLVSRGVGNHGALPRINDPCELILLTLLPENG